MARGPLSRGRYGFGRGAPRKRPRRLRATYDRKYGIRYVFGALDVHRDRLYTRMRPRRAGSDVLGFMLAIRLCYRARQKIYWIQDNLSANWIADIRAFADANRIELVPTPTCASYPIRIESHFRPIQEFVSTTPTTATGIPPPSSANTASPYEPIKGQAFRFGPTSSRLEAMSTVHLEDLRVQAQYARQRYDLYKARAYGPRPTSPARMRELQRACEQAEERLRAAEAEERRARTTGDTPPDPN